MKNKYLIIAALVIVVLGGAIYWYAPVAKQGGEQVFCTMEALICPDGSGVGRQGPKCKFAACPNPQSNSFTGELSKDAAGYQLLLPSPEGGGVSSAIYTMPLVVKTAGAYDNLLKKRVTVHGAFLDGSTFGVSDIAEADASQGENLAFAGTFTVGETKLVSGVKITLNTVTNDSRCPAGVQCIQAGSITANVTLESGANKTTVDLRSDTSRIAFDSYSVSIINVSPAKAVSREIAVSEYRVTFRVEARK